MSGLAISKEDLENTYIPPPYEKVCQYRKISGMMIKARITIRNEARNAYYKHQKILNEKLEQLEDALAACKLEKNEREIENTQAELI